MYPLHRCLCLFACVGQANGEKMLCAPISFHWQKQFLPPSNPPWLWWPQPDVTMMIIRWGDGSGGTRTSRLTVATTSASPSTAPTAAGTGLPSSTVRILTSHSYHLYLVFFQMARLCMLRSLFAAIPMAPSEDATAPATISPARNQLSFD